MEQLALLGAFVAAIAIAALAIRAYYLIKRVHAIVDSVEKEIAPITRGANEIVQTVKGAADKLDAGAASVAKALERVDHLTERLEPESWPRTLVGSTLGRLKSWVAGFRKGVASVRGAKGAKGEKREH